MKNITILIPTYNRISSLCVLLTSLLAQSYKDFDIVISSQGNDDISEDNTLQAVMRVLEFHNHSVSLYHHLPRRGIAEQRDFLLSTSTSPYSLFLDDDVIAEQWVIKNLIETIEEKQCGFVGQAVIGLSFIKDIRPSQQNIEFWTGEVQPEKILPKTKEWERHFLHNAANMLHVQEKLHISSTKPKAYKVAWVGGCVLYNTEKLRETGGFSFWKDLPKDHAGEDVLAQLTVMERYGGCAILPSGVYHQELPTTIRNREINAPEFFLLK